MYNINKFFKTFVNIANKSEEIKVEIKDWNKVLIFDINDGPKFTIIVKDGHFSVEYEEVDNPDVIMTICEEVAIDFITGRLDLASIYIEGDLIVIGQLQDVIKFNHILELVRYE